MMTANREGSPPLYDDHPSLDASLTDFEHNERSPVFGLPSQHSGFKSSEESDSEDEPVSEEPWSPPAWRQQTAAGDWFRQKPFPDPKDNTLLKPSTSASRSRGTSPQYESAQEDEDLTVPANIPLPRGSMSPVKEASPSPSPFPEGGKDFAQKFGEAEEVVAVPENTNNCVQLDTEIRNVY